MKRSKKVKFNTRGDIMMILDAHFRQTKLEEAIRVTFSSPSFNKHTRLMMSDITLNAISCKHFFDDRTPSYRGIKIIQDESLPYGEVVILTQFA